MIRFVDIRDQWIGKRFAFWSTTTDRFMSFQGEEAWDTWKELEELVLESDKLNNSKGGLDFLERVKGLCPSWVVEGEDIIGDDRVEVLKRKVECVLSEKEMEEFLELNSEFLLKMNRRKDNDN